MMLKFFTKRLSNKKGFTLIELIVVIAILAILAMIAIPRIGKFRTQAAVSSHNANVRTLESAATMYLAEEGIPGSDKTITWNGTTGNGATDEWESYLADWPTIPKGAESILEDANGGYTVTITVADDKAEVEVKPALHISTN